MLHLEVLDIDPLGAERLEDPRENTGTIGQVHAHTMECTWILVRGLEQASPVAARLADPTGEETRVAARQRILELLDAAAMLGERGRERLAVLEEDVDPDARVGARDAPAWFRSTFASACGRWLVTATSRSCADGSIAKGRAPRPATNACTAR